MALARVTTWSAGQVLTASALNGEFDNIISNAVANPLIANLACGNFDLTGIDELAFTTASAVASATGRLRRSTATTLSWHNGTEVVPLNWVKGADLASATALTLGTDGNYFDITGTTTITSISSRIAGSLVLLQFDGAVTLTHNATTLILIGGVNHTTAAGSVHGFVSEGGGNWREITRNALTLTKSFTSSDQTITSAGTLSLAHGLGVTAKVVVCWLVCGTGEANYSAGDLLYIGPPGDSGGANRGFSCVTTTTNLVIRYGQAAAAFEALDKTTGVLAALTNANWTARFIAYA